MSVTSFLFSPNGRIRRREYWAYALIITVVAVVVQLIGYMTITGHPAGQFMTDYARMSTQPWAPLKIFNYAMMLVLFWPGMCINIKRWHDRNRPAWIAFAIYVGNLGWRLLAPSMGPATAHPNLWFYYGGLLVILAVTIWQFVECGCLDGTKGPNVYGPSPKGIGNESAVF